MTGGIMVRNSTNRRKNYFIKKKFQANFIIKFCILVAASSLISGSIIYAVSVNTVTTAFVNSRLTIKSTADFILPAVLLSSAAVMVIIGLAAIGVTLFTSHRIAGPLYRLEKDIEEVASGNLNLKFSLRESDELKAMASSLNKLVDSLRSNMALIKDSVIELDKKASGDLRPMIEKIKQATDKFKT